MLQRDINTLNNWVRDNSLAFNVLKRKYMLISHKMQAEYFKLYNYTALALKRVSDEFKVGGPVVSFSNHY